MPPRAQYGIAKRRLNDTALYADAPGVVTAVGAEPGEVVAGGRMIVQIARDGGRDAVFDVPAALIETSPADPEITVALSQTPTVSAKGRIREVSPRADAVTGTFRVRVGLIDPPAELAAWLDRHRASDLRRYERHRDPGDRPDQRRRRACGLGRRSGRHDRLAAPVEVERFLPASVVIACGPAAR